MTVAQILAEAAAFRSCPINSAEFVVIEDGVAREATVWDRHELINMTKGEEFPHVCPKCNYRGSLQNFSQEHSVLMKLCPRCNYEGRQEDFERVTFSKVEIQ